MYKKSVVLFWALAAMLALAVTALAGRGNAPVVTVTAASDAFGPDETVSVNVTFTNPYKHPIRVLRCNTPFDGVKEDLFAVLVNGKAAEYTGAEYKRPAPQDKDYLVLAPGETAAATVDLAGVYDLSESGYYRISYRTEGLNLFSREANFLAQPDTLTSNETEVWIAGRETKAPSAPAPEAVAGTTGFTGCTSTRQSALLTARTNASGYSSNSLTYLQAGTVGPRYTTWFGVYSSTRYNTVRNHFAAISDAMDNAPVTFNCNCTDSAYAYVYSNQPYTIYLCNAFWNAPATGTDSKAGTLVHEMSHFNVVAGTSDYAYGQTAAKRLAQQNPKRAINNADSHEYFAENTPAQQ